MKDWRAFYDEEDGECVVCLIDGGVEIETDCIVLLSHEQAEELGKLLIEWSTQ